jgi:hypothetical protein
MRAPDATMRRWRTGCWLAAGAGALVLVGSARRGGLPWLPSYLFVWLFVLGLSLGSVALQAVHNLTGGAWGRAARPFLQAALRLFPLNALLALPLLLAPAELLPWLRSAAAAPDPGLAAGQLWYLNPGFFYARALVYFAVWLALAQYLREDRKAVPHGLAPADRPSQAVAALAFVLYALTTTFAAVDWTMALTPTWHSTEFGMLVGTGQVLSALAGAIVCTNALATKVDAQLRQRCHDLGNLALALVLVWAYLALMQFLIVWIEDLPDETPWYLLRSQTSWSALTDFVVLAHFVLPFLVLLSRRAKRAPGVLAAVAGLVLLACLADSFWLVVPGFRPHGLALQASDLGALLAIGGCWLGGLLYLLGLPALGPLRDTQGQESDDHGAQHA